MEEDPTNDLKNFVSREIETKISKQDSEDYKNPIRKLINEIISLRLDQDKRQPSTTNKTSTPFDANLASTSNEEAKTAFTTNNLAFKSAAATMNEEQQTINANRAHTSNQKDFTTNNGEANFNEQQQREQQRARYHGQHSTHFNNDAKMPAKMPRNDQTNMNRQQYDSHSDDMHDENAEYYENDGREYRGNWSDYRRYNKNENANDLYSKDISKMLLRISEHATVSSHLPTHGMPQEIDLKNFFQETKDALRTAQFPCLDWQELKENKSCIPKDHHVPDSVLAMIKIHLLTRLQRQVPHENDQLKSIINGHSGSRDGYKALYSLVYRCTNFLDEFRSGFGPVWENNQQPSAYASALETKLELDKMRSNIEYDNFEISLEMLNRAIEVGYKPALASSLKQSIKNWKLFGRKDFPIEFEISHLADQLAKSNESTSPAPQINQTLINQISEKVAASQASIRSISRTNNQSRKGRYSKANLAKNGKKQCKCCSRFGHNIGEDPCNFTAQLYWSNQYTEKHPEEIKKNAMLYKEYNKASLVNVAVTNFQEDDSADEQDIEQYCIKAVRENPTEYDSE